MSEIATGVTASLLTRAADVTLKERRPLVLMVRETPLHLGHLRTMVRLAEMGAIIAPPMPAFYARRRRAWPRSSTRRSAARSTCSACPGGRCAAGAAISGRPLRGRGVTPEPAQALWPYRARDLWPARRRAAAA